MNAKEFLKQKRLITGDCTEFIIKFDDGKIIELSKLMEDYLDSRINENEKICGTCSYSVLFTTTDGKLEK